MAEAETLGSETSPVQHMDKWLDGWMAEQLHVELKKTQDRHDEHAEYVAKSLQKFEEHIQAITSSANEHSKNETGETVRELRQLEGEHFLLMKGWVRALEQKLESATDRIIALESKQEGMGLEKRSTFAVRPLEFEELTAEKTMPAALQSRSSSLRKRGVDASSPTGTAEEAGTEDVWVELEKSMLDYGDMYSVGESIWDACLFSFTPYVSVGVSLALCLVYILNLVVQVTFMSVVSSSMLDSPVSGEILTSLLKFRLGIAHDVAFADRPNMRSMARQLCDEDNKLHLSGLQAQLFSDVKQFHESAMLLVVLSQFCWIVTIVNDIKNNYRFLMGLLSIRKDTRTCVVCDYQSVANEADPSLISTKVVVKMSSISCSRIFLLIIFVVIPRFAIAICLGVIGSLYLGVTVNMPDLLLNAMALAFIIELDEMFYSVFAPRRIQLLVENFEPTPVLPSKVYLKFPCVPWLTVVNVLIVGAYLLFLFIWSVQPFFIELMQARDILCSGNKDFVIAENVNTNLLYAARSSADSSLTSAERAVLQMTKLTFHPDSAWAKTTLDGDPTLGWLTTSNITYAKIFDMAGGTPKTIEKASFDPVMFGFMTNVATMTIEQSRFLPCRDLEAAQSKEAAMQQLRTLLQKDNIPECNENNETSMAFWAPYCGNVDFGTVRTLCPRTCGCHQALSFSMGAYQHVDFGCPTQCASLRSVMMDNVQSGTDDACADYTPGAFHMMSEQMPMKDWFRLYIQTVRNYLLTLPGYRGNLIYNAQQYAESGSFDGVKPNPTKLVNHLLDPGPTGFWETLANGTWGFLPGFKGYFGVQLEGCAFLTSPDFKWLFSHDLCDQKVHMSLRQICPVSCGCGTMENCPVGCRLNEDDLPCTDEVTSIQEVVPSTLSVLLGNSSIRSCFDIPEQVLIDNCWKMDMRTLRRYCPMQCKCDEAGNRTRAGFFGRGPWGCPKSCLKLRGARISYSYTVFPDADICEDRPRGYWMAPGTRQHDFMKGYILGLHQYMMSKYGAFEALIFNNMRLALEDGLVPGGNDPDVHYAYALHILHGGWLEPVLSGKYELLPNFSFPGGETGAVNDFCGFLSHFMFVWLLGIDVCSEGGEHQSLFYVCPTSCRCVNQLGCPLSCADKALQAETQDDHNPHTRRLGVGSRLPFSLRHQGGTELPRLLNVSS
eukprot:TRINITY_DN7210_c0_g1_i1.p1 TRINITY_DN7210_c0_g1~~TRINITY_DN7210_c0_g1_i1.p1  ORF type:complete len:1170 (-),score=142.39 TRINITY_DN7210_c0_g1_i1:40-3549(-)